MSAPSTSWLAKGLEQNLFPTDSAPTAPAAEPGSQEGLAAASEAAMELGPALKKGLAHPTLRWYGLSKEKGFAFPKVSQCKDAQFSFHGPWKIKHADVVIVAKISFSNISNLRAVLGAALVDKRACELGHEVKQWIKPRLVSGSGVVMKYLDKSGLQNQLGFHIVGYGCTTCVGDSRELDESVSAAIYENDIVTAAVLSENRNFASPPLYVAYYLAGSVNIACKKEPMDILKDGKDVYFWDDWPSTDEFGENAVLPHLDESTSLFGVYEGHGGKSVPRFWTKHLHMQVLRNETCSSGDSATSVHKASSDLATHAKDFMQFFVRIYGYSVSMQEDSHIMTIRMLIESACQKKRIQVHDLYATYCGKCLEDDKFLSCYPIYKDSTIDIRSRLRAGREQLINCKTFNEIISQHNLFHIVNLSAILKNKVKQESSVCFLSSFAQYIARQVLISLCRKHYSGKSFNGAFDASHILFYDGHIIFDNNLDEVNFTSNACQHDYWIIENIFRPLFWHPIYSYPLFVEQFLNYLWDCPAKNGSNSEAAIAYLTNHPALTSYTDRIAQCTILDSMVFRLNTVHYSKFKKNIEHNKIKWQSKITNVPAMNKTFMHDSKYNPTTKITEVAYDFGWVGCLHFSRNFFKHAGNQLDLEEIEAAFALNVKDFLSNLLQEIALKYQGPPEFDIIKLLGDNLADNDKRNS